MVTGAMSELSSHCDQLRSLHRPGQPLLLPNAWDVATASAVVASGFPVVATTSGAVAATLGYEDHEGAPADEMPSPWPTPGRRLSSSLAAAEVRAAYTD